jgi:hypothetical protein
MFISGGQRFIAKRIAPIFVVKSIVEGTPFILILVILGIVVIIVPLVLGWRV